MENYSSLREDNKLRNTNHFSTESLISGTTVLTDYNRRHISTSGLVQNAAERAQLESVGKLQTTIAP